MRDLFDQLLREGENGIERLVLERRQENVDLEFKEKADPSSGEISRQDKHNLAETLSAFSNSMGGLVVWGVKARKNLEGVDCATERKPIIQIEKFQSDITTLISDSLMPRHDGIRVDIFLEAPSRRHYTLRRPFSPRIRTLREILHKLRPEPAREPLPPLRHYEPPRSTTRRRRRG